MSKMFWLRGFAFIVALAAAYFFGRESSRGAVFDQKDTRTSFCCIRHEYEPTGSVLLSEHLFAPKYGGAEITRFLVSIGVDVIVLVNQPRLPEEQDRDLNDWGISGLDRGRILFVTAPHSSPWVRDYAPLILSPRNAASATSSQFIDFAYRTDAMLDDGLAYILGMQWHKSVFELPVFMDGGNFLSSADRCFATGSEQDQTDQSRSIMSTYGCETNVTVPDDFHEHIDMSVKFLNDNLALVASIDADILNFAKEHFLADFEQIQSISKKLDKTADLIQDSHRVVRIPTPLPILNLRRSYANALVVNRHILMPRFRSSFRLGEAYPDQKFLDQYEQQTTKIFQDAGFAVQSFPADGMIADGGTLHCVMVQLPFKIADLIK